MPALQEQDENLSDTHSLRGQVALPRAGFDEHRSKAVHEAFRDISQVG